MKRIISIMTCILLVLLCCSSIFAADLRFDTVSQLLDYWHMDRLDPDGSPYPDYVCGIWSRDGNSDHLNIALVEGETGESGKEEILSMLKNPEDITFSTNKYSYAELCTVRLDFINYMPWQDKGVFAFGIGEQENVLMVDIDMNNSFAQGFINDCFDRYGDRIKFENGSGVTVATAEDRGAANFEQGRFSKFPWASLLSMPIFILAFIVYAKTQEIKKKEVDSEENQQ